MNSFKVLHNHCQVKFLPQFLWRLNFFITISRRLAYEIKNNNAKFSRAVFWSVDSINKKSANLKRVLNVADLLWFIILKIKFPRGNKLFHYFICDLLPSFLVCGDYWSQNRNQFFFNFSAQHLPAGIVLETKMKILLLKQEQE